MIRLKRLTPGSKIFACGAMNFVLQSTSQTTDIALTAKAGPRFGVCARHDHSLDSGLGARFWRHLHV
jgi:hypothetical protein